MYLSSSSASGCQCVTELACGALLLYGTRIPGEVQVKGQRFSDVSVVTRESECPEMSVKSLVVCIFLEIEYIYSCLQCQIKS